MSTASVLTSPAQLVVPRASLQQLITAYLGPARPSAVTAVAPLSWQHSWRGRQALAGPLVRSGQDGRLPLESPQAWQAEGIVVVRLEPSGSPAPEDPAGWETSLLNSLPRFRLFTSSGRPSVACAWICMDWRFRVAHRSPEPTAWPRWSVFDSMFLSGASEQHIGLSEHSIIAHDLGDNDLLSIDSIARFSRQQTALGTLAFDRVQRSTIALIVLRRTGSMLAHGLVRMGVQRVLGFDPDQMEPHNEDGYTVARAEGKTKAGAVRQFARPLLRPGAMLDLRTLDVSSPVAGSLLAEADLIICCADNDAARLWSSAWALSLNRSLVSVGVGLHAQGAALDLRLIPAGAGCLACIGGFAQADDLGKV